MGVRVGVQIDQDTDPVLTEFTAEDTEREGLLINFFAELKTGRPEMRSLPNANCARHWRHEPGLRSEAVFSLTLLQIYCLCALNIQISSRLLNTYLFFS